MENILFEKYSFTLTEKEEEQFSQFLTLFLEYNAHTNLSAIRDEAGVIEKHFIDSLFLEKFFPIQGRVLDIGSGGGFPWIPLKIRHPEISITLLDSVGKKVKAMTHFASELHLDNVTSLHERAEVLAKNPEHKEGYDVVVSRATAYITDILTWAAPFLKPTWKIVLYKMPSEDELRDREKIMKKLGLRLIQEEKYTLADRERMFLIFERI